MSVRRWNEWEVVRGFLQRYPLHKLMTDEYEAFLHDFLPDIICGGTRSEVYTQYDGTEQRFYFENLRLLPPVCRDSSNALVLDSFDQAFRRKSTLSCVVCADVKHETREYHDCLTLEQVYDMLEKGLRCEGLRAVKARVDDGGMLVSQDPKAECPPHSLPGSLPDAEHWIGKFVVLIMQIPANYDQPFAVEDVYEQTTKKPFPEYDDRVIISKDLVINRSTPLFRMPLIVGVFPSLPFFCTPEDAVSPIAGAFIVNGLAKQIFIQLRLIPNAPFVFPATGKHRLVCETRSLRDTTKWNSTSTLFIYLSAEGHVVTLNIPHFTTRKNTSIDVPLHHVLVFLGINSRAAFSKYLFPPHIAVIPGARKFLDRVMDSMDWTTAEEAVYALYCAKLEKTRAKVRESIQSMFDYQFLSHCDYGEGNEAKLHFFGACLRKLALVDLKLAAPDDRDHMCNKQALCAGSLLAQLDRQLWRNNIVEQASTMLRHMKQHKVIDVNAMLAPTRFTAKQDHHFNSGEWSIYSQNAKQGYLQLKTDANDFSCYEQIGRVSKPIKRDVKNKQPRYLHKSARGIFCCSATPDGAPTGLINNLALFARLSKGNDVVLIARILHSLGCFDPRATGLRPEKDDVGFADVRQEAFKGLSEARGSGARRRRLVAASAGVSGGDPRPYHHTVYVNGNAVGCLKPGVSVAQFLRTYRQLRRRFVMPRDSSICFDERLNAVKVRCDIGRFIQLFIIASEAHRVADIVDASRKIGSNPCVELHAAGVAEWIDPWEEDECVVADCMDDLINAPRGYYTHAMLTATAILGPAASMIPSADRNQAPRNSYHSGAQQKQVVQQIDDVNQPRYLAPTIVMSTCNAQFPLMQTKYEQATTTLRKTATGYNVVVALKSEGKNQEDSVVKNRAALQRGQDLREEFVQVTVRTMINNNTTYMKPGLDASHRKLGARAARGGGRTVSGMAARAARVRHMEVVRGKELVDDDCYQAIGANGFPRKGQYIEAGQVILGRVNKTYEQDDENNEVVRYRCSSIVSDKSGVVHSIITNTNKDFHVVIFRLYSLHSPVTGDKYSSRHGQKGTLSCAEPMQDMPFSRSGIVPDIIINPHAIPSRMTIGHLLETIASKLAAVEGIPVIDGTSFDKEVTIENVGDRLEEAGFARGGEEEYYCGMTGRRYKTQIFTGIVFYEVLKHLAAKKAHARGPRGPIVAQTKQPTDGKKLGGGLRLGEMERDALISHGSAYLYRNLSVVNSDPATLYYCRTCRQQVNPPSEWLGEQETHLCSNPRCRSDDVVAINTTWSHNLLAHELRCLGISLEYEIIQSIEAAHNAAQLRDPQHFSFDVEEGPRNEEQGIFQ